MEYNFDGVYGPIPNENGEVNLFNYAKFYIKDYENITEIPEENKIYLDMVFTNPDYKVTNMARMFLWCSNLKSIDTANWNTGNCLTMNGMFFCCEALEEIDVSKWDTSKVKDMATMFTNCKSLKKLDVSKWDTSNVVYMERLFSNCKSLISLDLSEWDFTKVKNITMIFWNCMHLYHLKFPKKNAEVFNRFYDKVNNIIWIKS